MQKKSLIKNRQAVKKAILASRTSAPEEPGTTKVAPLPAVQKAPVSAAFKARAALKAAMSAKQ
jgi:hypothetical protein